MPCFRGWNLWGCIQLMRTDMTWECLETMRNLGGSAPFRGAASSANLTKHTILRGKKGFKLVQEYDLT